MYLTDYLIEYDSNSNEYCAEINVRKYKRRCIQNNLILINHIAKGKYLKLTYDSSKCLKIRWIRYYFILKFLGKS